MASEHINWILDLESEVHSRPVYTMHHEVKPRKIAFFHGPISLKNQFTKPLGPSLGVNRMFTKKNDHAPKSECADFFFNICPKRAFKKNQV